MEATIAAAQIDFYTGLVTEIKGASIPMGPSVVNFTVREPRGVVGRIIPTHSCSAPEKSALRLQLATPC
jgi:acyl-CoA reductase-like NAD-dependent aldehyde dehydrogenase